MQQWHISTTLAGCFPQAKHTAIWEAPPQGFVKLKFDGSVNPNTNYAGSEGITRDHTGNMMARYADQLETNIPLQTELSGLFEGIQPLIRQQWDQVIIEGDALLVHRVFQANELFLWD
eukprot:TRINITY_DN9577_c1_g1_i2.p2 TRINITY_DN9577_c1_g1~~TRINITY_DN9577_c1_g1_i2.p2  ORF type:complete len:118 (-),score=21.07 TRINITY_DN9577_c1_g1_i2:339-692(-)